MPTQSRRRFLTGLTATGAAGIFGSPQPASAEPPPETMTVRLPKSPFPGCEVPQYIAAELLRAEGFDDVRLVEADLAVDSTIWLARGDIDFDWNYAAIHIGSMNAGVPLTVLAGLHSANGFVKTIMDRRRYLKDINSRNFTVRGFAEREAVNSPLQGSAADLIKLAMIDIHREFEKRKLKSRMTLQVHDELVFDAHRDEVEIIKPIIRSKMINAISTNVPLEVDIGTGENWLEAH